MHFQALSDLVGSIYDTVVDASACPRMLNGLAELLGATGGAQVGAYNSKADTATMLAPRVDPRELPIFSKYWTSVWRQCDQNPIGAVIFPEMPISLQDRRRPEIFNGWPKPRRPEAMMGTTLLTEGPIATVVSVSRPGSEGEFDATEIRLFAALIPHLQRAVQLRLRLAALDGPPTSSAEMLNRLPHAVLLVDARARVIFANQAATKILSASDGLSLDRDGLTGATAEDTRRLRQSIADCAQPIKELGGAGGRLRLSRPGRGPLTMLVIPHRTRVTWIDVLRPTAILFITEVEQAAAGPQRTARPGFWADPGRILVRGRDIERRWAAGRRQPAWRLVDNGTHTPRPCVRQDRHAAPGRAGSPDPARPTGDRGRLAAALPAAPLLPWLQMAATLHRVRTGPGACVTIARSSPGIRGAPP